MKVTSNWLTLFVTFAFWASVAVALVIGIMKNDFSILGATLLLGLLLVLNIEPFASVLTKQRQRK
jgi:hypothetical protein